MYANPDSSHRTIVSRSRESRVLQQLYFYMTVVGVMIQDTETTTEEWFGLSQTDAVALCTASETSTLGGTTRSYLGGALLEHQTVGGGWIRCPNCWGTKVTSSIDRMGDTNLYHVQRTTTVYSVRSTGVDTKLTLE